MESLLSSLKLSSVTMSSHFGSKEVWECRRLFLGVGKVCFKVFLCHICLQVAKRMLTWSLKFMPRIVSFELCSVGVYCFQLPPNPLNVFYYFSHIKFEHTYKI